MVEWIRRGRVAWIFDENFVPDRIMGADNVLLFDPEKLKQVAMRDFDPDFTSQIKPGDFFVAGKNYGYGRAHAPVNITLEAFEIGGIIADSFTHSSHDGAINNAFPMVLPCPDISKKVSRWDDLEVNFQTGEVKNLTKGETYQGQGYAPDEVEMVEAGGMVTLMTQRLREREAASLKG